MANYDVLITNAANYHSPEISDKQRLALKIYAMAIILPSPDYTTAAGQRTIVANSVKALAGTPKEEYTIKTSPQEVAVFFQAAAAVNSGLATASLNSKMAAIPYLLNLDEESLAKTYVFLLGVINAVLA